MKNYKAKATGIKTYNRQYSTFVEYEYRGYKYEVEYANINSSYCVTPANIQHKEAQEAIDEMINKKDEPKEEVRYEDTAEYGFELFWRIVNEEE